MTDDSQQAERGWAYAGDDLEGHLQRGLGIGTIGALGCRDDPATARFVYACIARDHRWDWQVDDRALYLARLVRDLGLDPAPLVSRLRETGRAPDADPWDTTYYNVTGVLAELGRIGYADVVKQVRRYVGDGEQWLDVFGRISAEWPAGTWSDLDTLVLDRLPAGTVPDELWAAFGPGTVWAERHPRIAERVRSAEAELRRNRDSYRRPPLHGRSVDDLLAVLADPGADHRTKRPVLWELSKRPPVPALLELVAALDAEAPPTTGVMPHLAAAVRAQGATALGHARVWAALDERPQLARMGVRVLAEFGELGDVPRVMAAMAAAMAAARTDGDWCGADRLVDGLARFGPSAGAAVPMIRSLWQETPHSYERASYLRGLMAIDPDNVAADLRHALFDCEERVRMIGVREVRRDPETDQILAYLRDDPLESDELRSAAAERLRAG